MFCTKCGAQNADGVAFCVQCGNPLAAAQVRQQAQQVQQQAQQQYAQAQQQAQQQYAQAQQQAQQQYAQAQQQAQQQFNQAQQQYQQPVQQQYQQAQQQFNQAQQQFNQAQYQQPQQYQPYPPQGTATKSKKPLIIGIAVAAVVVVVVLILLLTGVFGGGGGAAGSPEAVIKNFTSSMLKPDMQAAIDCVHPDAAKKLGYDSSKIKELDSQLKTMLDMIKTFGGKYSINVNGSSPITGSQLESIKSTYKSQYGLTVEEAAAVHVEMRMSVMGQENNEDDDMTAVKIGGKWYADAGSIDDMDLGF